MKNITPGILAKYRALRANGERASYALLRAKYAAHEHPYLQEYQELADGPFPRSRDFVIGLLNVEIFIQYDDWRSRNAEDYGTWSNRWDAGCLTRRQYNAAGGDVYRNSYEYWHPPEWLTEWRDDRQKTKHAADCEHRARLRKHVTWESEADDRFTLDLRVRVWLANEEETENEEIYEDHLGLSDELTDDADVLDAMLDADPIGTAVHYGEKWLTTALASPGTDAAARAVRAMLRLNSNAA